MHFSARTFKRPCRLPALPTWPMLYGMLRQYIIGFKQKCKN
jgi:hypothetical protein